MKNLNLIFLATILNFISCVQLEEPKDVVGESSDKNSSGVDSVKRKIFNVKTSMGYVNLIARKKLDLSGIFSNGTNFQKIEIKSRGETVEMSSSEFYDNGGVIDMPVQRLGDPYTIVITYEDGTSKEIKI